MRMLFAIVGLSLAGNLVLGGLTAWMVWHSPRVGDVYQELVRPEYLCGTARMWRDMYLDPHYRARVISNDVVSLESYRPDITDEELKEAQALQHEVLISKNNVHMEYWYNQ